MPRLRLLTSDARQLYVEALIKAEAYREAQQTVEKLKRAKASDSQILSAAKRLAQAKSSFEALPESLKLSDSSEESGNLVENWLGKKIFAQYQQAYQALHSQLLEHVPVGDGLQVRAPGSVKLPFQAGLSSSFLAPRAKEEDKVAGLPVSYESVLQAVFKERLDNAKHSAQENKSRLVDELFLNAEQKATFLEKAGLKNDNAEQNDEEVFAQVEKTLQRLSLNQQAVFITDILLTEEKVSNEETENPTTPTSADSTPLSPPPSEAKEEVVESNKKRQQFEEALKLFGVAVNLYDPSKKEAVETFNTSSDGYNRKTVHFTVEPYGEKARLLFASPEKLNEGGLPLLGPHAVASIAEIATELTARPVIEEARQRLQEIEKLQEYIGGLKGTKFFSIHENAAYQSLQQAGLLSAFETQQQSIEEQLANDIKHAIEREEERVEEIASINDDIKKLNGSEEPVWRSVLAKYSFAAQQDGLAGGLESKGEDEGEALQHAVTPQMIEGGSKLDQWPHFSITVDRLLEQHSSLIPDFEELAYYRENKSLLEKVARNNRLVSRVLDSSTLREKNANGMQFQKGGEKYPLDIVQKAKDFLDRLPDFLETLLKQINQGEKQALSKFLTEQKQKINKSPEAGFISTQLRLALVKLRELFQKAKEADSSLNVKEVVELISTDAPTHQDICDFIEKDDVDYLALAKIHIGNLAQFFGSELSHYSVNLSAPESLKEKLGSATELYQRFIEVTDQINDPTRTVPSSDDDTLVAKAVEKMKSVLNDTVDGTRKNLGELLKLEYQQMEQNVSLAQRQVNLAERWDQRVGAAHDYLQHVANALGRIAPDSDATRPSWAKLPVEKAAKGIMTEFDSSKLTTRYALWLELQHTVLNEPSLQNNRRNSWLRSLRYAVLHDLSAEKLESTQAQLQKFLLKPTRDNWVAIGQQDESSFRDLFSEFALNPAKSFKAQAYRVSHRRIHNPNELYDAFKAAGKERAQLAKKLEKVTKKPDGKDKSAYQEALAKAQKFETASARSLLLNVVSRRAAEISDRGTATSYFLQLEQALINSPVEPAMVAWLHSIGGVSELEKFIQVDKDTASVVFPAVPLPDEMARSAGLALFVFYQALQQQGVSVTWKKGHALETLDEAIDKGLDVNGAILLANAGPLIEQVEAIKQQLGDQSSIIKQSLFNRVAFQAQLAELISPSSTSVEDDVQMLKQFTIGENNTLQFKAKEGDNLARLAQLVALLERSFQVSIKIETPDDQAEKCKQHLNAARIIVANPNNAGYGEVLTRKRSRSSLETNLLADEHRAKEARKNIDGELEVKTKINADWEQHRYTLRGSKVSYVNNGVQVDAGHLREIERGLKHSQSKTDPKLANNILQTRAVSDVINALLVALEHSVAKGGYGHFTLSAKLASEFKQYGEMMPVMMSVLSEVLKQAGLPIKVTGGINPSNQSHKQIVDLLKGVFLSDSRQVLSANESEAKLRSALQQTNGQLNDITADLFHRMVKDTRSLLEGADIPALKQRIEANEAVAKSQKDERQETMQFHDITDPEPENESPARAAEEKSFGARVGESASRLLGMRGPGSGRN